MSHDLWIFPTPENASCTLRHDTGGWTLTAVAGTHPSGRPGQLFTIPDGTPQDNGAALVITAIKKVPFDGRGTLHLGPETYLRMDDFHLTDEKVCPDVPPIPPQPPTWPTDPLAIILRVYATGQFNLATKAGCGQFTEACATALHEHNSTAWGHLQKFPPQNHYPDVPYVPGGKVHAVDAVMLLVAAPDGTAAGIYDIIVDSESVNAHPACNFSGGPNPLLWYYPAK